MNQDRRKLIAAMGAMTAGQAFLDDNVKADSNPAGLVADRSSTIRIKSMKATPAGSKVYLKMETNHGITGWGEIDQLEPKVAAALATSLLNFLTVKTQPELNIFGKNFSGRTGTSVAGHS